MPVSQDPLWVPSRERVQRSQMHAFLERCATRFVFDPTWEGLRRWSIESSAPFWEEMLRLAGIRAHAPARAVVEGEGMLGTRWFPGMTLNYAEHLLRFAGEQPAIEALDERGRSRTLSRDELRAAVARCAAALRAAGVGRGDRVAGFLPNIPETVIAMLATASLGAVWSSCSPDFGTQGVLDRFGQIAPKVLLACDGYAYAGKRIELMPRVAELAAALSGLAAVVVVPFLDEAVDASRIPRGTTWDEFTALPGGAIAFEPVPFDHPLFVMYSSGTTGKPKCIVHGHGGTLIQHAKEHLLHCDIRAGERVFYFTTCGWMMWNWLVSALGCGATLVLYEGNPAFPGAARLWDVAAELEVNVFGTSPKFLGACEKAGVRPAATHDLSALRCVLSTGSPLSAELFRWVYDAVKADVQLSSISGGTDIISCFMLGNPILPVYAGEIQCRGLGMDVHAWDDRGRAVIGEKGELVCTTPFPSQPVGFWNDPDGAKYRAAYFESFAGQQVWRHGDYIEITERGGVIVYGRSDATLNPGGVRIGTSEIYRVVETIPEVIDSIVIGRDTPDADVEVCLFVVLRPGCTLDAAMEKRLREQIAAGATRRHVPRHIRQVREIPHTISGKKVELAVRQMVMGQAVSNRDALANPSALDEFARILG